MLCENIYRNLQTCLFSHNQFAGSHFFWCLFSCTKKVGTFLLLYTFLYKVCCCMCIFKIYICSFIVYLVTLTQFFLKASSRSLGDTRKCSRRYLVNLSNIRRGEVKWVIKSALMNHFFNLISLEIILKTKYKSILCFKKNFVILSQKTVTNHSINMQG